MFGAAVCCPVCNFKGCDIMNEYNLLTINQKRLSAVAPFVPNTALVLGSGLGGLIKEKDIISSVDYSELYNLPVSTVSGHKGRFVFANLGGVPVIAMQGRVHIYEGYTSMQIVRPIRLMKMLGAETLILTNAAGGIRSDFSPGDIMLLTDHISSFVSSPLVGENIDSFGSRFPDMSEVYSKMLQGIAYNCAEELGITLKKGVYLQTTGPNYETPAEIRAFASLGADAVGMSTAVESMAAVHMGMNVCALSLITNLAAGLGKNPLSHKEVKQEADKAGEKLSALVCEIVHKIDDYQSKGGGENY